MRRSVLLVPVLLPLLAGCVAPPPPPVVIAEPAAPVIVCDATPFQTLVNKPIAQATYIDYPGTLRVVGPDDYLTKDYDIQRMTVTTLRNRYGEEVIGRIFCG